MKRNVILLQSEIQTFCFPSAWVNQYVVCRFELQKPRKKKNKPVRRRNEKRRKSKGESRNESNYESNYELRITNYDC